MARPLHPIVLGGLLVGILDIAAAFAVHGLYAGVPPRSILQAIASGLLGREAFRGGAATAALGLALHFVIAFAVVATYYLLSRRWHVLVRRAVPCGLAYGVAVYLVMNRVVLPLSRVTTRPSPWVIIAVMIVVHMVCVGLPTALVVRRGERRHASAALG
ncbi:hypothetical protein TBR22_A18120 [Luteitalea sp. TBR-22]|uniref:hypothetical protein n=1 Tax=Luteitalea sp. TBR-22 TaxID=2802971 RepID=UPI001AF3F201|nr:hypothetical protein [Luteitalea sp. TBR-22]BCS32598.1 hypothetical protein TBR22_A18120 [Luteitalea sp. TBR-22]